MVNAVLDQLARQLRAAEFGRAAGRASCARHPDGSAEDRLIARYFKPLAKHPGAFGFTDDAAAITPPAGHDLVLKTDGLIAGVHFFPDDPADGVAPQGAAGEPVGPRRQGRGAARFPARDRAAEGFPRRLARGFRARAGRGCRRAINVRCSAATPIRRPGRRRISIAAFGTLPQGTMVRRAGAQVGDHVFVSGTIGDAALGLQLRQDAAKRQSWKLDAAMSDASRRRAIACRSRAMRSPRRCARMPSAAMDVSDGLVGDLAKLCRASNVSADVEVARVPLSDAAHAALGGGCRADRADPDRRRGLRDPLRGCAATAAQLSRPPPQAAGVAVTEIGRIVAGERAAALSRPGRASR